MNINMTMREIRGRIFEILYVNLPKWTSDELICELLQEGDYHVSLPEVQGHLRYLSEKGYVELKQSGIDEIGLARNLSKLTVQGIDYLEGHLPNDNGIARKDTGIYATYPEIRGWILKILYMNLPEWTGDQLIAQLIAQGAYKITPPQVLGHLNYLAEKEFIEIKEASIEQIGLSRTLAKLTSEGVDFVEGNHPEEPGVIRK